MTAPRMTAPRTLSHLGVCSLLVVLLGACGRDMASSSDGGSPGGSKATGAVTSDAGLNDLAQSRFVPLRPDSKAAATFNYKVYEFADDGSWISVVPMPPKAGDVEIRIKAPGNYEAKLTNQKCASSVIVKPSTGDAFELTAGTPTHAFEVKGAMQMTISMAESAPNNYFCNVAVAVTAQ